MDRGSHPTIDEALRALTAFYGPVPPPPRELFAFVVWDLLSVRAIASRRDHAWQALKRIPALTPDALFRAPKDELKAALEGLGGGDERLDHVREVGGHFRRHRNLGERLTRSLLDGNRVLADVPHLSASARRTAPLLAGGHTVPAVDDGATRVLVRVHGLDARDDRQRRRVARRALLADTGRDLDRLSRAVVVLSHHASHACVEQAPHCGVCPLRANCAFAVADSRAGASPDLS